MTNSKSDQDNSADTDENEFGLDFASYNLPTDLTAFQAHLLCLIYRLGPAEGVDLQEASGRHLS